MQAGDAYRPDASRPTDYLHPDSMEKAVC